MSEGLRIDIRADVAAATAALNALERDLVPKATVRALNKAAENTRVEASRLVREKRPLKASVVKDALKVSKANRDSLTSAVTASGKPIPMREYGARQTRKGVTVAVTKGQRKLVGQPGRRGFLVAKIGGHVFQRKGKARLPIQKQVGPSIPGSLLAEKTQQAWVSSAEIAFRKRLEEELRFAVDQFNRKR